MPYWFDGNNLIGLSAADARADRPSRAAFMSALSVWRATGGGRFLIWFDGDDPADMQPPSGVAVRFSAPESADAAICRRLREIERPWEVIVVTNDRELSSRCRNIGAKVLDWGGFSLKMQSRSFAPFSAARPATGSGARDRAKRARQTRKTSRDVSQNIDIDDWLHYFGMDGSGE